MRKITEQAARAFLAGQSFKSGNTTVEINPMDGTVDMYLHGNLIAHRDHVTGVIKGTLAGWPTVTTRDRLNGIARLCDGAGIYQSKHTQYVDGHGPVSADSWYLIKAA